MGTETLDYSGEILDNVHGFIRYTAAEEKIIDLPIFKRLQNIKQLSVIDWLFPGAEHTRYIHSLGVMHIADKIAIALRIQEIQRRKILRFAGLLHDIGHYPLSHVGEYPYDKSGVSESDVKEQINSLNNDIDPEKIMKESKGLHHEAIGGMIVVNNSEIRDIIEQECGKDAPEIVRNIIIGNVEGEHTDPLLVQIIHSELDADGIDYLMRDAHFSGTGFGSFEIDNLIRNLVLVKYEGKEILCIKPKAIPSADQYLLNKFFAYSQVVFNKHVVISEWVAEQVILWLQENGKFFPSKEKLREWARDNHIQDCDNILSFTDLSFWKAVEEVAKNKEAPENIRKYCNLLMMHKEPELVQGSEKRIVTNDVEILKKRLLNPAEDKNVQFLFSFKKLYKHVPEERFIEIQKRNPEGKKDSSEDDTQKRVIKDQWLRRLMEGICVMDENNHLRLLCDDERSLMHSMHGTCLAILRAYRMP